MRVLTFNRRVTARVASGIGALGLIGAVLIFLVQRQVNAPVFLAALVGVFGLTIWLALMPDDLQHLISGRQALYGGNSVLVSVLFGGAIMIAVTLASNSNISTDLTSYQTYSLRPNVAAVVKSLDKPVLITVFYTNAQLGQQAADQPILKLFSDASSLIHVNIIDPQQQPIIARNFGAALGAHAFVTGVTADGQPDLGPGKILPLDSDTVGEQQIADALLLFQARGKFKVLFTVGNGETNTNASTGGEASSLRSGLDKVGIITGTLDLTQADIPADTTALVLLAPKKDLTAAETDKISQYTASGGRLLIMAQPLLYVNVNAPTAPLDYTFLQDSSPMTTYLWQTWGIRAQNDIVYDPGSYVDSLYNVLSAKTGDHSIMYADNAGQTKVQALLFIPRSWQLTTRDQKPADVAQWPLITTTDQAFGATDIRAVQLKTDAYQHTDKDLPGPLVLAVAAQNIKNNSRIVVIGDGQWAQNDVVTHYGNALLWSNMMNWLTEYDQKTSVTPVVKPLPLSTTTDVLNEIAVFTMIVVPGLVLILGTVVWWDRARR